MPRVDVTARSEPRRTAIELVRCHTLVSLVPLTRLRLPPCLSLSFNTLRSFPIGTLPSSRPTMSGLELAASVVAVIDLSTKIVTVCSRYALTVSNAKDDISRLQHESTSLKKTLQNLRGLLDGPHGSRLAISRSLCDAVQDCSAQFERLGKRLEPGTGRKAMSRLGVRSLKWPLKSKDVDGIIASLERQKNAISLALNVDQA